ncbi:hypothetical protein QFC20_004801 [Naganishia adeliensis]|uniref:Uncharacterized protein n=1 Tax=Naganishia adeliensis TaxID=92952 RepID=A0ACC2VW76_9TREE|nr:hypothetical protein QFC20_004801 [Naganishia adeliensis]
MAEGTYPENQPKFAKRQGLLGISDLLPNTVDSLLGPNGLLQGLATAGASAVNPNDKVPDAAHPFKTPGPTDQRGPCPGLNALDLPRNGIVTAGQVEAATSQGFNMAPDLSGLLNLIAILFGGNIEAQTFSIGGEDDRTYSPSGIGSKAAGRQYGLDAHSRCEGDASAMRRDYFTNGGDNHNVYPDRFKRFIKYAKQQGGQCNVAAANALYGENVRESIANNPKYYNTAYTLLVVLGEVARGPGRVPIHSQFLLKRNILGRRTLCYVPERFPENWYRRSTPYGVTPFLEGLLPTYLSGPALATNPLSAPLNKQQINELGCAIAQGLESGIPVSLLGSSFEKIQASVQYLQSKIASGFPNILTCSPGEDTLQETGPGGSQHERPGTTGVSQSYGKICA